MNQFTCRAEIAEDEPFIRRLMLDVLAEQLGAACWPECIREPILESQYRVRRQGFQKSAGEQPGTIVLVNGEPAAWYVAAEQSDGIHLINLIVQKEHRGKGIGSAVLRKLSADPRKAVTLSVARNNQRALDLYTRMGFRQTGGDGVHCSMERPAQ
jgi:ribosomal protein S18 acetylase RimI-like enzyme